MTGTVRALLQQGRVDGHLELAGQTLVADRSGALYWPSERTLIVADLHFEKGSAFARRGQMLPPYDTRETLIRLSALLARYAARTLIALGDSFHDGDGPDRISSADARSLRSLQRRRDWIWVRGNHDPHPHPRLGGNNAETIEIGGIGFRHEPDLGCRGPEVAGHLHPAARLAWNGASIRRRCFAGDARRLVLPAFGAFTGGLNVLSEPFVPLFPSRPRWVAMLGASGIYRVPTAALTAD